MTNLDSYITQLLSYPDPELDARRKSHDSMTKGFERRIAAVNKRVNEDGTLAEKINLRKQEKELRDALHQHKLSYQDFIKATPNVPALPSLNG